MLIPHKQTLFQEDLDVLDDLVKSIFIQRAKGQPLLKELLQSVSDLPWRTDAKSWLLWCQMRNNWAFCLVDEIKTDPARKPELDQHITQLTNELADETDDAELFAQWVCAKGLEARYYCWALDGANAEQTEKIAENLDVFTQHFPEQQEAIQEQRVVVWDRVIYAYNQIPSDQGAEKCETLAQRVDQIAAHFPDDHEAIQEERATAWRYVIYAYSQIPSGRGAEKCEALAQRVDQIVSHFPDDHEAMQSERSDSWYRVCKALSEQQSENFQKNKFHQATAIVLLIAKRFPHNESIQEDEQWTIKLLTKMNMNNSSEDIFSKK